MTIWRLGVAGLLAGLVGLPLAWALAHALGPENWPTPATGRLLAALAVNTALLGAGTIALAVPAGVALAVLIERTNAPGRGVLLALTLLPLAVPLPLWVSGWVLALGGGGVAPLAMAGRLMPWSPGLGPSVLLHALLGMPWVALIVAWGLRSAEPELEEDALLSRPPGWVLWNVTLPRARVAVLAATLWLAVQTSTEVLITDLFDLRTFAAEVFKQQDAPQGHGLGRALLASSGLMLLLAALTLALARRAEHTPPLSSLRRPLLLSLGRWRWPAVLTAGTAVLLLAAVPVGGLVWKAGGLSAAWLTKGGALLASLATAASAGAFAATLALVAAWLARGRFRTAVLVAAAVAWAMPGPVLGLAMKGLWEAGLERLGWPSVPTYLLWDGPSYLPPAWVAVVRFFPLALAVLLPAVDALPRAVREAARLDGLSPWQELTRVIWPLVQRTWARAAWAVMVLALGEVSAGKLVSTPGAQTFAELLYAQLHYGVTPDLAAECLLLIAAVLLTLPLLAATGEQRHRPALEATDIISRHGAHARRPPVQ